jgi:hypothetical protein
MPAGADGPVDDRQSRLERQMLQDFPHQDRDVDGRARPFRIPGT